jgi:O-methyltransferase
MPNSLKLNFLKRILTDSANDEKTREKFFENGEYPSKDEMEKVILSPIDKIRETGFDWPERAHTMIGMIRLNNLHKCLDEIRENKIDGDIIETGVWRGGACIFMKKYLDLYEMNKKVFVADSFAGLPKPEHPEDEGDHHHGIDILRVSLEEVKKNFSIYRALDENVVFLKGWFSDTLPNNKEIEKLCILRMDGDMYKSTIDVYEACWEKLVKRGFAIVDDWCLKGAQKATVDFRNRKKIKDPIITIDGCGVFWQKS